MKIIENKTIYKCDFCNKKYIVKSACEKHERWCAVNPENQRACQYCVHISKEINMIEYNDHIYHADSFKCKKLNKYLYPPKVEKKRLPEKYPGTFENQEPMPKECEYQTFSHCESKQLFI